jgi:hypothetical protein
MKFKQFTIIFLFLLALAVSVSAQDEKPNVVWKNLQERYESFEDVQPIIQNPNGFPVFIPISFETATEYGQIRLLKFDDVENQWKLNVVAFCGTLTKKERKSIETNPYKYTLESEKERKIILDGIMWFNLKNSYVGAGFVNDSNYLGKGRYKFQFPIYKNQKSDKFFLVESPEFEVFEKDFKK